MITLTFAVGANHDHIIRNQRLLQNISNYIVNNPFKWTDDSFHDSYESKIH